MVASYAWVIRTRVMFGVIVGTVVGTRFPLIGEILLCLLAFEPVPPYIHGFVSFGLHSV